MKLISFILLFIIGFTSFSQEIISNTYYGEGKAYRSSHPKDETGECWVDIKKVYENGDILVKSSFDSFFSNGYVLKKTGDRKFSYFNNDFPTSLHIHLFLDESSLPSVFRKTKLKNYIVANIAFNEDCTNLD